MPALSAATLERLRPIVPAFASLNNPIDLTAGILAEPKIFADALQIIADDPNFDAIAIYGSRSERRSGTHDGRGDRARLRQHNPSR